jgi:hypothetical protein
MNYTKITKKVETGNFWFSITILAGSAIFVAGCCVLLDWLM